MLPLPDPRVETELIETTIAVFGTHRPLTASELVPRSPFFHIP